MAVGWGVMVARASVWNANIQNGMPISSFSSLQMFFTWCGMTGSAYICRINH